MWAIQVNRKICCSRVHTFRWLDNDSLLNNPLLLVFVMLNDSRSVCTFSFFVMMHRCENESKGIDFY